MPLPPLNENNTGRYFVDYTANGRQHTALFRYSQGAGPVPPSATHLTQVGQFLDAIAPLMPTDFVINGARYAAWMSNITIPWAAPTLTVAGAYTPAASDVPAFFGFVGRDNGGRRGRVYMLGVGLDPSGVTTSIKYRITAAEKVEIGNAIAVLDASNFVTIGNSTPEWYDYANLGYHAYWQKKARG